MIGLITDSLGIFIGAFIGILLKKRITENHTQTIFTIMGIITIVLGLQGVIESDAILIVIISLFIGSILGVSFDIDYRVKRFAQRFTKGSSHSVEGIVTVFMVLAAGALSIIGPMKAGLEGDLSIMNFKAVLDFASAVIFATIYGKSVYVVSIFLFIYQLIIFLSSKIIEPYLTQALIDQISQVGSIILIAIGFDLLDLKKIQVINLLPSLLMPILINIIIYFAGNLF